MYNKEKKKTIKVHKLVANAFLGKSNLQVDHIDGNKLNNKLNNLEYVTPKENIENEKIKNENRKLKAEMKDGVISIKLYALQTENEKLKKKIDLMENYMVENGWEICFDNIYAELNNCNGMERDWCRGDKLEKQDIHKYFSKKLLESEE